jgi:hypothetical protein
MKASSCLLAVFVMGLASPSNAATAAASKAPNEPPRVPGLRVKEYARHPDQATASNEFFVDQGKLGRPLSHGVATTLHPWMWNGDRNAIASGFLEVPEDGDYAFVTDSFYDRNLLMVAGKVVCGFRDGGDTVATVPLKKGSVSILCYGVVESRGGTEGVRVRWKPPGQAELSPIPAERLSHNEDAEEREARLAKGSGATTHLVTVADDFVVDVYHNGVKVRENKRQLLEEHHGATAEKIVISVHPGDWLVFHVVNNRLRWQGRRYFAAAGMADGEVRFASDPGSPHWSACDDPEQAKLFIRQRGYGTAVRAQPITKLWEEGNRYMKKHAGEAFGGKPLWGRGPSTWIKYVSPGTPASEVASGDDHGALFDTLGAIDAERGPHRFQMQPPPRRWPVQILSAIYGTGGKDADVTAAVKEHVEVKQRSFSVSPRDLGADPNPYWNKSLHIVYMKDGVRREQRRNENETVLAESFYRPQDAGELREWLQGTRWSGREGEIQFQPDSALTKLGAVTPLHWEVLTANSLRITWSEERKTEYRFDYVWSTFQDIADPRTAFHEVR